MIELFLADAASSTTLSSTDLQVGVLRPQNDLDARDLDLTGIERIELSFPKFVDGRA